MSIKKDEIIEFLPRYLVENDYFLAVFDSLFDNVFDISVSKQRNGNYFFTPFQSPLMDYANFSLFVSNKGISDISLQKEERTSLGDDSLGMKSKFSLSAIKKSDDCYSITSRFITVSLVSDSGVFKKKQFSEKREYSSTGKLISKICNCYLPEEVDYNDNSILSWNENAILERGTSYFYLGDGTAITREFRRKEDSLNIFPQYNEHIYHVMYDGDEEKSRVDISEDEYQSYFYDAMYGYKKENKNQVKKLEKSFG